MITRPGWIIQLAATLVFFSTTVPLFSEESPNPNPGEVELLQEIVGLRELSLKQEKRLYEEGRLADFSKATLALYAAKAELAKASGDLPGAITQLKNAEELRKRLLKSFEMEYELGTIKTSDLAEAKIQLLKARLERVRLENALREEEEK